MILSINKCFDCPAITPDGSGSCLWQGGGDYEISSGPVWQRADFQVTIPTNQGIPLLFELITSAETAGWAYGGAGIERYRLEFTCPEIPEFGTHIIDSDDYWFPGFQKAIDVPTVVPTITPTATINRSSDLQKTDVTLQINSEPPQKEGISFGDFLTGAAGAEYLRTGQVTVEQAVAGIEMPAEHPFVMVDGNAPSGLMIPVKIPRSLSE